MIISLKLQNDQEINSLTTTQNTRERFSLCHPYLYCAWFRLSLRQSESSLSICWIANGKFILRIDEKCLFCVPIRNIAHTERSRFVDRIHTHIDTHNESNSVKGVQLHLCGTLSLTTFIVIVCAILSLMFIITWSTCTYSLLLLLPVFSFWEKIATKKKQTTS